LSGRLVIHNRQRSRPVSTGYLRRIVRHLLDQFWPNQPCTLGVGLLSSEAMTRLNETFVHHQGCTDVITFDYTDTAEGINAEIFVCLDEAVRQARRFHTTWQSELTRYIIHGLLHLQGYDDATAAKRRRMKREEDRWLIHTARRFALSKLARQ
jgi:rRNA maturation RNase YbeY